MPFPFLPGGVLLALGVLAGALTVFGLALRVLDRAFASGRQTVLPGLVSGIRTWTASRTSTPDAQLAPPSLAGDTPTGVEVVELFDRPIQDRH